MGGQSGALEDLAVANDISSGTGGWDGEYGFFGNRGGVQWLLADTVSDGTMAVKYKSPSFYGFNFMVSFIPDSSALVGAGTFVSSYDPLLIDAGASYVKNRFEGGVGYAGTFGGFGLTGSVGGAVGSPEATTGYQDLSVITAGIQGTYAGFAVGGNYMGGKYVNGMQAAPEGASSTQAFDAGVTYDFAQFQVGAQYYGYTTPIIGDPANNEKFSGAAIGAKWVVNPGVTLFLDGLFGAKNANGEPRTNYNGVGIGTYFQW